MTDFKSQIDLQKLPKHVAVIMDGNGRWAKRTGMPRIFGHRNGVKAVRETTEAAAEIGVKYLTLYAFSTENWSRPEAEVNALMTLLVATLGKELKTLTKNDIRLNAIGDLKRLPKDCYNELIKVIDQTKHHQRMTLTLALNYSGRWEIQDAMRKAALAFKSGDVASIEELDIEQYLSTQGLPDPEFLIRTSGEQRLSNYLLWQLAYAEFYFTEVMWPDFRKDDFYKALLDYQDRERRFGKTSEQLNV